MLPPAGDAYSPADLPDDAVGDYGVTVRQVGALVREAQIIADPDPLIPDPKPTGLTVLVSEAEAWITDVSAAIATRLVGLDRLATGPAALFTAAARTICADGAASYIEAAVHPERARMADTSYAQVLWTRYQTALDQLAEDLSHTLGEQTIIPAPTGGALAYRFPPAAIPDAKSW